MKYHTYTIVEDESCIRYTRLIPLSHGIAMAERGQVIVINDFPKFKTGSLSVCTTTPLGTIREKSSPTISRGELIALVRKKGEKGRRAPP